MDGSSSGGAPAPFLLKTYEMVDDSSTDAIVSWSANNNSFVVWNPPEFGRILLPKYFKHNNFSSFIRQLNTYGFRKIDSERWEFANEDFVKDQKHLLKNIHRRKPIHSHSHQPSSVADQERVALEEEMERLSLEKAHIDASLLSTRLSAEEKLHMEDLMRRVDILEKRQKKFRSTVEKAMLDPTFVELLGRKIESMDLSSYKKRRLPQVNHSQPLESNFVDSQSSCRPEFSNIFQQDSSNKLRLELSPAVSDVNMLSHSTESSDEGGSPRRRMSELKDTQVRTEGLLFTPEAIELSGTDTSFNLKMNTSGFERVARDESSKLHSSQHRLVANEDGDGLVSCHLNLSLASSPLQANKCSYSARGQQEGLNIVKSLDLGGNSDTGAFQLEKNHADGAPNLGSSQEIPKHNQGPPTAPHPVNDVFWEQFLTERPGSSDNEEASSNYRANSSEEQESSYGMFRNAKNMERLTL